MVHLVGFKDGKWLESGNGHQYPRIRVGFALLLIMKWEADGSYFSFFASASRRRTLIIPTPKARVAWVTRWCIDWIGRRRVKRWFTINEVIHSDEVGGSAIRYSRIKR